MSKSFTGFEQHAQTIAIHAQFVSEVMSQMDDAAELKVCLYGYYALHQKEGEHRYLTRADFVNNTAFLNSLATDHEQASLRLDTALNAAVRHGFYLRQTITQAEQAITVYIMNTPRGIALRAALVAGDLQLNVSNTVAILPPRPNIFAVYENNIGMLTATTVEALKAAQAEYPEEWVVDAIRIAAENKARHWRYIEKVLARWQREGRDPVQADHKQIEQLYRENFDHQIGSIIQAELEAAQAHYPQAWIVEAMTLAITNNVKRWTYVRSVLAHWQQDGRDSAPNPVVQYYRENFDYTIGTVMRAELDEAQTHFSDEWILDAMHIALENNVKRWTYVRIILERWKQEGRSDGRHQTTGRSHQSDQQFAGLDWSGFTEE